MEKNFIITEKQTNQLLQVLGEVPGKLSFNAIDIIRSLKEVAVPASNNAIEEVKKDN